MTKNTSINWGRFSITSPEFIKAEKEETLSQLLHCYFSKNNVSNQKFISELADMYPKVLIRSIRVNRAFLKFEHIDSLKILHNHSNSYLNNHFLVFTKLAKEEKNYFDEFNNALQKANSLSILEGLSWVSLWFEEKRAELFKTQQAYLLPYDVSEFTDAISFFLSYYLHGNKDEISSTNFNEYEDVDVLFKIIPEAKANGFLYNPAWICLDKAYQYLYYQKGTLDTYSFDMNYEVEVSNGVAEVKFIDISKLKRWYIESEKLAYWYNYYRYIATELVNQRISQDPDFIKDTDGIDGWTNYEGAIRSTISHTVAHDYCINESMLWEVPASSLIQSLVGFTVNALGRYVLPMDELNYENPNTWLENILTNACFFEKQSISAMPTRFLNKGNMVATVNNNFENASSYSEQLVDLISNDISNYKFIDRFNPSINLLGKPFIKLNNFYFAFNGILGETNSQINTLTNIMDSNFKAHSLVRKSETDKLEKKVQELFYEAGFTQSDCSIIYSDGDIPIGDFDIVVYEKGVMLLIELKRSKFRIHLSDAHNEYENSLVKASEQLNKAQDYISFNFNSCKNEYFKKLNIPETEFLNISFYPLIVSTSFENDHTLIRSKHLKISLFELQNILENGTENTAGNKLEGLINKILREEYWAHLNVNFELSEAQKRTIRFPV
jgi:hypothetical protein